MKKMKYTILITVLFMVIGIAAVTTNVVINGSTSIAKNPDDFNVYFSNVLVNGTQDLSLVRNEKTLVFYKEFSSLNERIEIAYDVTNSSKNYDAQVSINCTPSTSYLTITNDFDTSTNLVARSTRSGVLSVALSKANTGADITEEISCTITVNAVERTSQVTGTVVNPLERGFSIGDEITIGEEKFNVIDFDDDTVTMLAQYNIDENTNKQTPTQVVTVFSDELGWTYIPGPKEIDIQNHNGEAKVLLNNYVNYIKTESGDISVTSNLITLKELERLGCTIQDDYSFTGEETCINSPYKKWLINGQKWWTRSASSEDSNGVWKVTDKGELNYIIYADTGGVRPVITISKDALKNDLVLFTIEDTIYQAVNGMTWREWIDSKYNTDGYYICSDYGNNAVALGGAWISNTNPSDIIGKNEIYKFSLSPIPIP